MLKRFWKIFHAGLSGIHAAIERRGEQSALKQKYKQVSPMQWPAHLIAWNGWKRLFVLTPHSYNITSHAKIVIKRCEPTSWFKWKVDELAKILSNADTVSSRPNSPEPASVANARKPEPHIHQDVCPRWRMDISCFHARVILTKTIFQTNNCTIPRGIHPKQREKPKANASHRPPIVFKWWVKSKRTPPTLQNKFH